VSRRREEQFEAPGKDSFLDVVANVVAILIILVIVVGSQAQKIVVGAAKKAAVASIDTQSGEVAAASAAAGAVEAGIDELQRKISEQNNEIALRSQIRGQAQVLVTVAEQRLNEHRAKLTEAERARYDLEAELIASRGELSGLDQVASAVTNAPPIVLQHLPTPMAKTVFGKEVHFRLLDGKLAYIPWDETLEHMKSDAPKHIHKLQNANRVELSLPVREGFGARYILRRSEVEMQTRAGVARQSRVELERVYFVQADAEVGEPLEQALSPNSMFRSRLIGMEPQRTTVTVWVYDNSFEEYRQLKAELFKLGYLTAGRPLPPGMPIGGSPDGTRSSAE
jgi:hypothetical protein